MGCLEKVLCCTPERPISTQPTFRVLYPTTSRDDLNNTSTSYWRSKSSAEFSYAEKSNSELHTVKTTTSIDSKRTKKSSADVRSPRSRRLLASSRMRKNDLEEPFTINSGVSFVENGYEDFLYDFLKLEKPDYEQLLSTDQLKDKFRILDNLLILTNEHIDSSEELKELFPCLLNTLLEICNICKSWAWAEIYFYSLVRIVDNYMVDRNPDADDIFSKENPFEIHQLKFLINLASFLACRIAQFDPDDEPELKTKIIKNIIPILVELTGYQNDVCQSPGLALMYIFFRINAPLSELVYEASTGEDGFDEATTKNEQILSNNMAGSSVTDSAVLPSQVNIYHPATIIRKIPLKKLIQDHEQNSSTGSINSTADGYYPRIYSFIREKQEPNQTYILRFLKIFWIRCAVLGQLRRNQPNELEAYSSVGLKTPNRPVKGDEIFPEVYRQVVLDSYITENDVSLQALYCDLFDINE